ncbi:unnamed protein product [Dibothriocephalus latus]|uniref:Uncharacterized protein n=1 Tax=Dibothriocephalus latus TaxID=60516 RepID=A0A3P7RB39_DIBLA|nr:unnamed protein product [Dibothriocephalus latus]
MFPPLHPQTLACDFNSGSFALAHLLGLSQAELLKSSLLVYSLLLQATSGTFLLANRTFSPPSSSSKKLHLISMR